MTHSRVLAWVSVLLLCCFYSYKALAFNTLYPDLNHWEQWAVSNGYTISNFVYSEGNSTGKDGVLGNEFVCIRDDVNQVIIGRPDVCGTYYSGLGYGFADITTDPTNITAAPDIISNITDNLVDQNLANWGGCNYTGVNRGGTNPGGPMPNCGQDIINWSYGGYWVYRRHAIEQALKQAGVNVDGYQWEFTIKNLNGGRADQSGVDRLDVYMTIWDNSNNVVHQKYWVYNTKFDWTTFSGTELFANPLVGQNLRDWQIQMFGMDSGYWSGFYGPEMKTPEIRMLYSSNPCAIDPLLHPDCDGYVQAYTNYVYDQTCTANPLYDPGCPGYAQAYETQQCSANPLYSPSCPGYTAAYYNQQCSFNPLYDAGCPGYQEAYFDQQCSADPFYDTSCPGYAQAFYDQQCGINPLYDSGCPGYATAYYNQQCSLDALYDSGCPGYQEKYFATYVQPELEKQAQQASSTSTPGTLPTTIADVATVKDPVASLTSTPATGDATVDQVLRETANVSTNNGVPGVVEITPTAGSNMPETSTTTEPESSTTSETTAEAEVEAELASLEEGAGNEEVSESSDNVDESSDGESDSGDSESGGKDSGDDDKNESESKTDSKREEKKDPEQSKRDKLKEIATQRAMMLAERMGEVASLEQQQALQAQITALINFVPGFNAYGQLAIPGTDFYPAEDIYNDKDIPENRRGLRNGLAQQLLHEKMVEQQYNLGANNE